MANISDSTVKSLQTLLLEALKLRVLEIPAPPIAAADSDTRVAVLFSGGLDCTTLALLIHHVIPASQGIDLINVAFENPRSVQAARQASCLAHDEAGSAQSITDRPLNSATSPYEICPDRQTGRKSFAELCQVAPTRQWRFVTVRRAP